MKNTKNWMIILGILIVIFTLYAIAQPNYIRIKNRSRRAEMALPGWQREMLGDAGWSQPNAGSGTTATAPAPALDEMQMEGGKAMAEAVPPGEVPAPPQAPGSQGAGPDPAAFHSQQFDLERWFSPAVYAADNKPNEQYLIRNGEMLLNIDNYDAASTEVTAIAQKYGGVVTDSNMQKSYDGTRSGFITLRVPSQDFFSAWGELLKVGEVLNQSSTAQDVSQEYVAAVSRLKNLTTEQTTLQGMLADAREVQRTRGLGEAYKVLLDTQARLSDVTGELQATEDQVARLADQITRSTIKVNMGEKAVYQASEFTWGFGDTLKAAGKAVVLGIKGFINWLIFFIITTAWWLALLIAVVRWQWLRWRKKHPAVRIKG
jgi:hypothetical protein